MGGIATALRASAWGLIFAPLIGAAQYDMGPDWPAEKQEMLELGLRFDSAWALYQHFEQNADDKMLEPDEVPDWTGLWEHLTRGYDPELGARPLRRAIQRLLEDPMSERVLLGEFKAGTTILVGLDEENGELTFEGISSPETPPVELAGQE